MSQSAAIVRFIGMLASPRAEAVVRECIAAVEQRCRERARWEVSVQPPLATAGEAGYAVRAQAQLADGSTITIRSDASELLQAVRDAFDGVEQLLKEVGAGFISARCAH
jgi:hypothetical protein